MQSGVCGLLGSHVSRLASSDASRVERLTSCRNVVQSALARHVLNTHLIHLGVHAVDGVRNEALDGAFNELWANNGTCSQLPCLNRVI